MAWRQNEMEAGATQGQSVQLTYKCFISIVFGVPRVVANNGDTTGTCASPNWGKSRIRLWWHQFTN